MLVRTVCALLVMSAGAAIALAGGPANEAPKTDPAAAPTAKPAPTLSSASSIVVHTDTPAKEPRDSRVQVGDMKISMATWSPGHAMVANPQDKPIEFHESDPTPPAHITGAIGIPDNTLGPGEPLWSIRERENAARKLAQADADLARAQAERAPNDTYGYSSPGYTGYTGYGWLGGFNTWGGYGSRHNGLRGPVTTTITRSDDLGSTAQRAYFDAAYPRLNGSQDAHDRAVSQFGRDATPPIVRIQNDVDQAHTNANKEHPKR